MVPKNTIAPDSADVYVIAAHPHWRESRINRLLRDVALDSRRTQVCDLYGAYADYNIDVPAEQARLRAAKLVVMLHPIHWYSMPPLMKLWLDDVLTHGWAYGGGTALAGKDLWLVASTGGGEETYHPQGYNRYFFNAFLPPYEQTAVLCGMRFLPPLIFHGAHRAVDADVAAHVKVFRERLDSYPAWPAMDDREPRPACEVPSDARPAQAHLDGGGVRAMTKGSR